MAARASRTSTAPSTSGTDSGTTTASTAAGGGATTGSGTAGRGTAGAPVTVSGSTAPVSGTKPTGGTTITSSPPTPSPTSSPPTTGAPSPPAGTGAYGTVSAGPTCPVERVDHPCPPRPVSAEVDARQGGRTVASTTSNAQGDYSIRLAPGGYTLVVVTNSAFPRCNPVDVPEVDMPAVRVGMPARIVVPALAGREFEATVTRTGWALDAQTRTLRVQIDLPNPDGLLRPGMSVPPGSPVRADISCDTGIR